MKKIIICFVSAFAAYVTLAGYAWFSSEINAILVSSDFPQKYRTLESPVKLYGSFDGSYWTPPYAKVNYTTGDVTTENETSIKVTTFVDLNNYGKYDPADSVRNYQNNCKSYVTDEFGQQYAFYDENVAAFYTKYESMNMNAAVNAFDQLKTKFQLWISSIRSQTGGLTYDASKLAEKVKEIDNALDKASSQISDTVKNIEQEVANFNQSVLEAQQNLVQVQNATIEAAQDRINNCVSDFSSFVSILEEALEGGEGWKEGAKNAYTKLDEAETEILAAIRKLEESGSTAPEVAQAIQMLTIQANTIVGLKTGLWSAIDNNNKSAAEGILRSAKNAGIINSKKAMQRIANAEKTYQSQARMLNTLQKAAIGTIDYVNMIEAEINSLRESFNQFAISTMDNFHEIGSFLCSTNSMEYLDWRKTKKSISDMSVNDVKKWFTVTMQDPLFRNMKDQAEYQSITKMTPKSGYGYYNNIMRFLSSSCFMTYFDLETTDRFESAYQTSPFLLSGFRGFKEQKDMDYQTGNYTTNWYANKITAPKNWADGTSIIVTNGVFTAKQTAGGYAIKITGTENDQQDVEYVVLGSGATTNNLTFATEDDSNVKVTVSGDSDNVTVTFGVYYK